MSEIGSHLPEFLRNVRGIRRQQQHERLQRSLRAILPFGGPVHELHHGCDASVEAHCLRLLRHLREDTFRVRAGKRVVPDREGFAPFDYGKSELIPDLK